MMRFIVLHGALWLALLSSGCSQPDLGLVPFKCNSGTPRCPDGYGCVKRALDEVCLRAGIARGGDSKATGTSKDLGPF